MQPQQATQAFDADNLRGVFDGVLGLNDPTLPFQTRRVSYVVFASANLWHRMSSRRAGKRHRDRCRSGGAGRLGLIGFVFSGGIGVVFSRKPLRRKRLRWFWGFGNWVCFAQKVRFVEGARHL